MKMGIYFNGKYNLNIIEENFASTLLHYKLYNVIIYNVEEGIRHEYQNYTDKNSNISEVLDFTLDWKHYYQCYMLISEIS